MNNARTSILAVAVMAALAFPVTGGADEQENAATEAFVQFGQLVTPAPAAGSLAGTLTHFLLPDDVTIRKDGSVTFVVNGGGHGIAIHRVNKKTTRQDIAEDLCQGGANEADRGGRFVVCTGTIVTGVGTIVGTQNLGYPMTARGAVAVLESPP